MNTKSYTETARCFAKSKQLSEEIERYIPGGVDSPFRAFTEVGGHTIFFNRAGGSKLFDVDGNEYIDYLVAWGPAILGHCQPDIVAAVQSTIALAPIFGAPHEFELAAAKGLCQLVPSVEKVRFVNSGTEAVMSAIRLARGYKKRDRIVMFEGCYHGHSDSVLASQSHSSSAGVPNKTAQNTVLVPYNDIKALDEILEKQAAQIAAVIIEPVAGSMGVIAPGAEYLQAVEDTCRRHDVLLIFDEVLTGMRVARGGAQALYKVTPDLTCFGKALGGGMPIGAYGGRQEIMERLLPAGDVYQAGTFSGNPATMAATVKTLELLDNDAVYERMEKRSAQLFDGLASAASKRGIDLQLQRVGSMFGILFAPSPVNNFQDSLKIDGHRFTKFFHYLLAHGVYFPPSSVDAACLSAAHTEDDVRVTIENCERAFATF